MRRDGWIRRLSLIAVLSALGSTPAAGDSPVADAAEKGDRAAVERLVAAGADVDRAQPDGMTALHWAAYRDDAKLVDLLLRRKARPDAPNREEVRPLSLACVNGNGAIVEQLLAAGADPNTTLPGGETALMTAARTGRLEPVRALLKRGAKVDAREVRGQTAIMWAAAEGNAEVVSALIEAGADFTTPLPSGFTPFLFATREGHIPVVRLFIKQGVDIRAAMQPRRPGGKGPERGMTALDLAVENGHFDLARVLLDAGADPNDQGSGFTPLHRLTWVRKPNRGDGDDGDPAPIGSGTMTSLQFAELLISRKAEVNARLIRGESGRGVLNRTGATPLLLACKTGDLPLIDVLLKAGADPKAANASGSTPLMAAAGLGTLAPGEEAGTEEEALAAVRLLLKLGNDVNAVDKNGETAMHGAAYKSFPRVAELLVANGADVKVWNRPNRYGWTPLDIAEGRRPGNFKPSADTIAAIRGALIKAGITPPPDPGPSKPEKGYVDPK